MYIYIYIHIVVLLLEPFYLCNMFLIVIPKITLMLALLFCFVSAFALRREMCLWDIGDGCCLEHTKMANVHTHIAVCEELLSVLFVVLLLFVVICAICCFVIVSYFLFLYCLVGLQQCS